MKRLHLFYVISFLLLINLLFAQSAEILFISNVNGIVKNCGCGDPALGGIPRIVTVVQNERKNNPGLFVIDGGDFFNSYSYPDLNHVVSEQYHLLRPNILAPGDQEVVEGLSFLKKYSLPCTKVVLGTNLSTPEIKFKPFFQLKKGLIVLSYLDKSSFDLIKKPFKLKIINQQFEHMYSRFRPHNRTIIIFHGTEDALSSFVKQHPLADVVLWGHAQSDRVELETHPVIIAGGTDGAYVVKIELDFSRKSTPVSVEKIPIGLNIVPDSSALTIIKKWDIH